MFTEEERAKWRKMFKEWKKTGESPWNAGIRKEQSDATTVQRQEPVQSIKRTIGKSVVPLKWIEKKQKEQPVVSQDTYTRKRVAQETRRTWLSDAADLSHAAGEALLTASTFMNPGGASVVKFAVNSAMRSVKNRAAAAIYRNIAPASYKESYLGSKKKEVLNAVLDFITPRSLPINNNAYKNWLQKVTNFGNIPFSGEARDEIYRAYLGLPYKNKYYTQISPRQWTHNIQNTPYLNFLKQIDSAYNDDPFMQGIPKVGTDYINSSGGNVTNRIIKTSDDAAEYIYSDMWDVNPMSDANRASILPKNFLQKYSHIEVLPDGYKKIVWNSNLPKYVKNIKDFELSSLTNGEPISVNTKIPLKILRPELTYKEIPISDGDAINKATRYELDRLLDLNDVTSQQELDDLRKIAFNTIYLNFLKNPEYIKKSLSTKIPLSDYELFNKYGFFVKDF